MNSDQYGLSIILDPFWSVSLDQPPIGPPVISGDLLLIATQELDSETESSTLYAIRLSDGNQCWQHSFEYALIGGLAITADDHILVAITSTNMIRNEGMLISLDLTGQECCRWARRVQRVSAPAVSNDSVCFTANNRSLVILDPSTCQERTWIALGATASLSAPALVDRVMYIPCRGPHLLAMGLDGHLRWRFEPRDASGAWLDKTPVVVGEHLFAVLSTGEVLALRTDDRSQVWHMDIGPVGKRLSAPTTDGQHLYVGARDGLHALALDDGCEVWAFPTSRKIVAAPIVAEGAVYTTCHDHHIYALDAATGRELWQYKFERRIEVSPALVACGEPAAPGVLVADRGGTLTAIACPLSAEEYKAAGHWIKAASAYALLDQPARGAQLLEDHDEPFKAAELWQVAGELERAAQQYEKAKVWQQAAELWCTLDRPLKLAEALEYHARSLEDASCSAEKCAAAWMAAAEVFNSEGEIERRTSCQREIARCMELPIINLDVQHKGLVLQAWTRFQFIVRNEGYGPARNIIIRASGNQFEGQVMTTRRIVTLREGREHTDWLDVCPREYGDSVPLRVRVEYQDKTGEPRLYEQTLYVPVARVEVERGAGQVLHINADGGTVFASAVAVEGGDFVDGDKQSAVSGEEMIRILFLAANPTDTARLRLDEESRAIDQALRQAEFRDRFDIRQHWAVRATDLQNYLLRHKPDIVHFSGHGDQSSEIILQDNAGNSHSVSVRALSTLFSVLKDNVRCVVLNACFSEHQAQAISEHIDCVIGMSTAIGDAAAISFAAAFYQALGFGRDVKTAFDLGCVQIDLENLDEHDIPQLLTVKADPAKILFVHKSENS